jgi:hypothetical protein
MPTAHGAFIEVNGWSDCQLGRSWSNLIWHRTASLVISCWGTATHKQYICSQPVHRFQCCSIINNAPASENTLEVFYIVLIVYTVCWVSADTAVQ